MKLSVYDVHSLTIIAMDKSQILAKRLRPTLKNEMGEVADGLMGIKKEYSKDVLSAINILKKWANPKK